MFAVLPRVLVLMIRCRTGAGERPIPVAPDGWAPVPVKAASLNHHDVWTLRGVGISADRLPIVLWL